MTIFFFFFENHAISGIMWKNIVEQDRTQVTICACSLHAGYRIPHASKHTNYVKLTAFPMQQRLQESASEFRHTYIVFLVRYINVI
jgi:hypothetical protein